MRSQVTGDRIQEGRGHRPQVTEFRRGEVTSYNVQEKRIHSSQIRMGEVRGHRVQEG